MKRILAITSSIALAVALLGGPSIAQSAGDDAKAPAAQSCCAEKVSQEKKPGCCSDKVAKKAEKADCCSDKTAKKAAKPSACSDKSAAKADCKSCEQASNTWMTPAAKCDAAGKV